MLASFSFGVWQGEVPAYMEVFVDNNKKSPKIWNFQYYFVSLHRQNVSFGYPGRIPRRQDYIDTALGARHHDNYSILKVVPIGMTFIVHTLHCIRLAVMRALFFWVDGRRERKIRLGLACLGRICMFV